MASSDSPEASGPLDTRPVCQGHKRRGRSEEEGGGGRRKGERRGQ